MDVKNAAGGKAVVKDAWAYGGDCAARCVAIQPRAGTVGKLGRWAPSVLYLAGCARELTKRGRGRWACRDDLRVLLCGCVCHSHSGQRC